MSVAVDIGFPVIATRRRREWRSSRYSAVVPFNEVLQQARSSSLPGQSSKWGTFLNMDCVGRVSGMLYVVWNGFLSCEESADLSPRSCPGDTTSARDASAIESAVPDCFYASQLRLQWCQVNLQALHFFLYYQPQQLNVHRLLCRQHATITCTVEPHSASRGFELT